MHNPLITRLAVSDALVVFNGADIEQIQQIPDEIGFANIVMASLDKNGNKVGYKVKMDTSDITAYYESCSKGVR